MNMTDVGVEAGGPVPPAELETAERGEKEVKVWDPFVRVFHWSLVALFIGAYVTGDEIENVHVVLGYGIAALVAARVVWGLVGSRHARFTDFVRSPRDVIAYLRDIAKMRAARHLGHNPAGGAMIVALLVALTGTCISGYLMTTALWGVKWIEHVHEAFANATVGLVLLHVAGVVAASLLHRENLVRAMLTGRKRAE